MRAASLRRVKGVFGGTTGHDCPTFSPNFPTSAQPFSGKVGQLKRPLFCGSQHSLPNLPNLLIYILYKSIPHHLAALRKENMVN